MGIESTENPLTIAIKSSISSCIFSFTSDVILFWLPLGLGIFVNLVFMKNTYILALIFSLALGYFLYAYFGIIFIVFIPPVFIYLISIIKSSILFQP